jgi:hypothetical protein
MSFNRSPFTTSLLATFSAAFSAASLSVNVTNAQPLDATIRMLLISPYE